MGGGVEVRFAAEAFQVLDVVVDHEVAEDKVLTTGKGYLLPGEEREVLHEPVVFVLEGVWKFHCGGNDKDLILFVEPAECVDGVGHDGQVPEKAGGTEAFHNE